MAEQEVINVYGLPQDFTPPTPKQRHVDMWYEVDIPKKLHKKLNVFLKKELKKFYKECKCQMCKESRKRKK